LRSLSRWLTKHKDENANILFLPVLIVVVLDGLLTLWGQPFGYWAKTEGPNEANIIGNYLLHINPYLFFYALLIPYFFSLCILLKHSPFLIRCILFSAIGIHHGGGFVYWVVNDSSTWLLIGKLAPALKFSRTMIITDICLKITLYILFSTYFVKYLRTRNGPT